MCRPEKLFVDTPAAVYEQGRFPGVRTRPAAGSRSLPPDRGGLGPEDAGSWDGSSGPPGALPAPPRAPSTSHSVCNKHQASQVATSLDIPANKGFTPLGCPVKNGELRRSVLRLLNLLRY